MLFRRVAYYSLLSSYLADAYASKAESMMHLTLWSWCVQILYFELPLPNDDDKCTKTPSRLLQLFHGPAFTGAHALFAMYLWTLYANPRMEYDLAPPGRPEWLVMARAVWFHAVPVVLQWIDLFYSGPLLKRLIYKSSFLPSNKYGRYLFYFWMAVGGYFAMGLTWEQCNGDSAGTYKVTTVSPETFVAVSKAIGVLSCAGSFFLGLRPAVLGGNDKETEKAKQS